MTTMGEEGPGPDDDPDDDDDVEDIDPRCYAKLKLDPSTIPSHDRHAVYGSLLRGGLIERFDVYERISSSSRRRRVDDDDDADDGGRRDGPLPIVVVRLTLGNGLNGHPGTVHGGILSLLFDEAIGCACECLMRRRRPHGGGGAAVTAYLNVSYRRPMPENATSYIRVYFVDGEEDDDRERTGNDRGRKMRFRATLGSDADDVDDGRILYAEASCLYVRVMSRL